MGTRATKSAGGRERTEEGIGGYQSGNQWGEWSETGSAGLC